MSNARAVCARCARLSAFGPRTELGRHDATELPFRVADASGESGDALALHHPRRARAASPRPATSSRRSHSGLPGVASGRPPLHARNPARCAAALVRKKVTPDARGPGGAGRSAVDARRVHGGDELAVEPRVAGGDDAVALGVQGVVRGAGHAASLTRASDSGLAGIGHGSDGLRSSSPRPRRLRWGAWPRTCASRHPWRSSCSSRHPAPLRGAPGGRCAAGRRSRALRERIELRAGLGIVGDRYYAARAHVHATVTVIGAEGLERSLAPSARRSPRRRPDGTWCSAARTSRRCAGSRSRSRSPGEEPVLFRGYRPGEPVRLDGPRGRTGGVSVRCGDGAGSGATRSPTGC